MTTLELQGITHELRFWKEFVKTDRFLKGWVGCCKTPELNNVVAEFINEQYTCRQGLLDILDVGSGAVSILNGMPARITAADPLGGLYGLIFDYSKYGLSSPLPHPAEELSFYNDFDIVHCSNALDHCQNPLKALGSMIRACKKGGFVIIQGFENEAEYENYQGFHQWNLQLRLDGTLIIKSKNSETIVSADFIQDANLAESGVQCRTVFCSSEILPQKKDWFIWIIQKL